MIDDKEIDDAAYRFATSQEHGELLALIDGYKEGYKDAINEFVKNLWHSVDEEPKLGKRVLVKINGNLSLFNSGFVVEHLRNFGDHYGIESWLYIDDLFPKEGGEQ